MSLDHSVQTHRDLVRGSDSSGPQRLRPLLSPLLRPDRREISLNGTLDGGLPLTAHVSMREGAVDPLVSVGRKRGANPLDGGSIEGDVIGIAAHETDVAAILGDLEIVARA